MLVIKPKYMKKKKKPYTKSVELSLEPEQKKIKIDHLINGKGIVYE